VSISESSANVPALPPARVFPEHRLSWFVGIEDTCVYPRSTDAFDPLDEHDLTNHTRLWRSDIDRIVDLGVDGVRYGMSWPKVHVAPGRYDWRALDPALERLHSHKIHVIADFVHYGCPPWLEGSFVDDGFVDTLTEFATAALDRYGSAIGSVTPINEPLTTASFCGLRTVWPPALGSWDGWAQVLTSLAAGAQSVIHAVRSISPATAMVHVEAAHLYEAGPAHQSEVRHLSRLGDLATDLILGRIGPGHPLWSWLIDHGVAARRLRSLHGAAAVPDVLGVNYYPDLTPRVLTGKPGDTVQMTVNRWSSGLGDVLRRSFERYRLPMLVTETSVEGDEDRRRAWLDAVVDELLTLRSDGIDVRGLTWWPLIDFIDWSYISDGVSVEEFVTGVVDAETRELRPVPIPGRVGDDMQTFVRHMGLLELTTDPDGQLVHESTTVSRRLGELIAAAGSAVHPAGLWTAGDAFTVASDSVVSLDGVWELQTDFGSRPIVVPGLWEAQGLTRLDGTVRYRTQFNLDEPQGHWTLRFDAVMDEATVTLNGHHYGVHSLPYTPFEIDVTGHLDHRNQLLVTVTDPPAGSTAHLRSAHGKQGWAPHEFPSPPSLYLTYGGIWQPVSLRRHGVVAIRDLACNLDPDHTVVTVEIHHLGDEHSRRVTQTARLTVEIGDASRSETVELTAGDRRSVDIVFGRTGLAPWSPETPTLHRCAASVAVDSELSDSAEIDIGLRVVEVNRTGLVLNGQPFHMKSVLVQGFHPDRLYAEGDGADIESEIRAARDLGFNTLRLHLRPFAPEYLRVCDRLGMLVHCDISIGEPIQHDELDSDGQLARRCETALVAQVRRDHSHPSIVMWSCMNEIGIDRPSLRATDRYERFVRRMVSALTTLDATRPFIENDWIDPDPDRVFRAALLTAHWYGHLDRDYLDDLEHRCRELARLDRPVAVTEFGDWGLPDPHVGDDRFYAHRDHYANDLAASAWPSTLETFSTATQIYQGIADRLQIDVMRRSGAVVGYCLTELTDVPWEFNGVLDIDRRRKQGCGHIVAANMIVSPILTLDDFGVFAGSEIRAEATVVNDSPDDIDVDVTVRAGTVEVVVGRLRVPAHSTAEAGSVRVCIDGPAGESSLAIELCDRRDGTIISASYPIVVHPETAVESVVVLDGTATTEAAFARISSVTMSSDSETASTLIIGEDALGVESSARLREHLAAGAVAVVLAQSPELAHFYPFDVAIEPITAQWGGTPFRYTTDEPAIRGFPCRSVLHVHDAVIGPRSVISLADSAAHAAAVAVGVFKPLPQPASGMVVAAIGVGGGTAVVCQYRLEGPAVSGSATAVAALRDVVNWGIGFHESRVFTAERRDAGQLTTTHSETDPAR